MWPQRNLWRKSTSQQGRGVLLSQSRALKCSESFTSLHHKQSSLAAPVSHATLVSKSDSSWGTSRKTSTLLLGIEALTWRDREPMPKGTRNTWGALPTTLGWNPGPCSFHPTYLQSLISQFPRTQIGLPKTLLMRLTCKGSEASPSSSPPVSLPYQYLPPRDWLRGTTAPQGAPGKE